MNCIANDPMNSMLIGRAFCRLLAVGRLLHWKFCWFWLFLRDFHSLDKPGHPKRSPQNVRDKGGLWTGRFWPTWTHILKTTTTSEDLRVTRLTCNCGVSFRNRYYCLSQWPVQCSRLWSEFLLVWIWISWKFIHRRMLVSNGWVLSLKIQFLLSIRVSRTSTGLSSLFFFFFIRRLGCLNVEKWMKNFKRV